MGGDALPGDNIPLKFTPMSRYSQPAFRIRGSLPWFNFLDSPTTWNINDYRFFIDQMVKMKANFIGFHSYDSEPFGAYTWQGKLVDGESLVTSKTYGWGTVKGLATARFGFGTGNFYGSNAFGSRATTLAKNREDAIRRAQHLMAEALTYARERGLKVAIGFELSGDPTNLDEQQRLEARLTALIRHYPMLNYVWLWEPEAWAQGNNPPPPPGSYLNVLIHRWYPDFAYLGNDRKIDEAARMAAYYQLAYRILKVIAPHAQLMIGGWGGDRWDHFSDFFPGFDRLLPKGVIFDALDNINPAWDPGVSVNYGKLAQTRQRWAIPWFESDGAPPGNGHLGRQDQWAPQCNVTPFSHLLPDALQKGCQGILGIHWRTRGVERVAAYTYQFAWNPQLTTSQFWWNYANRDFGSADAPEMSRIMQELEALGPRWTGGSGQTECGNFQWFSIPNQLPKPQNLAILSQIKGRLQAIRHRDETAGKLQYLSHLDHLIYTIDWLTNYDKAALLITSAQSLTDRAQQLLADNHISQARSLAHEAWLQIQEAPLGQAIRSYSHLLSTRSDWGVLATINVKAVAAYRHLRDRIGKLLEMDPIPSSAQPTIPFRLVFKRPPSESPAGMPLTFRAYIVGEAIHPRGYLYYRTIGASKFQPLEMKRTFRDCYTATIPGSAVTTQGLEFYIEATDGAGHRLEKPTGYPKELYTVIGVTSYPLRLRKIAPSRKLHPVQDLTATVTAPYTVRLQWASGQDSDRAIRYQIWRAAGRSITPSNATMIGSWISDRYYDATALGNSSLTYAVQPVGIAGGTSGWSVITVHTPTFPPPPLISGLKGSPGAGSVRLTWNPLPYPVHNYEVYRKEPGVSGYTRIAQADADTFLVTGLEANAPYQFVVQSLTQYGQKGAISAPVTVTPLLASQNPVLSVSFNGNLKSDQGTIGTPEGTLSFVTTKTGRKALLLGSGGAVTFAPHPIFQLNNAITLSIWVKFNRIAQMPVIVSAGRWDGDGFFLQVFSGGVRFYIGNGNVLDTGRIQAGKWYNLVAVFDGHTMRVYINGKLSGERTDITPSASQWNGGMVVGQYTDRGDMYQVLGQIADLRLYDRALSSGEVADLYRREHP